MNSLLFKVAPTIESDVIVNVKFGILFGKIPFMRNSIFVHYDSLNHQESIVDSLSSDKIKVAVVTDPGVPIIKVHSAKFDKLFSYYGTTESIAKFKKYLAADRKNIMERSHSSERVYDFVADGDENIPSTSNTPRKNINESTDSGFQVNGKSLDASRSLLDSIIESVS